MIGYWKPMLQFLFFNASEKIKSLNRNISHLKNMGGSLFEFWGLAADGSMPNFSKKMSDKLV